MAQDGITAGVAWVTVLNGGRLWGKQGELEEVLGAWVKMGTE